MQLYDPYGIRTTFGIGMGICTFIVAAISAALVVPVTGWAIFSTAISCEVSCTPTFRWFLAILLACPVMLTAAIAAGLKASFGKASGPTLALTFIPAMFVAGVFAVNFGYLSFTGLAQ